MTRRSIPPQPLKLPDPRSISDHINFLECARSAVSPVQPTTKPTGSRSPFKFNSKKVQTQPHAHTTQTEDTSKSSQPSSCNSQLSSSNFPFQDTVSVHSLPSSPVEPQRQERRERPSRSSFFNNYKASRSSNRLQTDFGSHSVTCVDNMLKDNVRPTLGSRVSSHTRLHQTDSNVAETTTKSRSNSPPHTTFFNTGKKDKPKSFSLRSRSFSMRDEQSPTDLTSSELKVEAEKISSQAEPIIDQDRSLRAKMTATVRHHSAERLPSFQRDRSKDRKNKSSKDSSSAKSQIMANLQKEQARNIAPQVAVVSGNTFLNNLKSQATKGAGALSKGLFGKGNRNGLSSEKLPEVDDEHYELKVISLPLVQQTRLTRISKKLEDSRDKTEFWMPAFPWRAIDYLNYKGSEVEGLYRVPGSGPEIKKWRRRFDQELDIDLFEQQDLYDINIIGSMLKAWLRELPDELLPKATQEKIARECANSEKVPQLLVDELSNLSPFNYYLLFAITCHLSLLLAHSEKNKMDYRNLCICFQPCMKIDAFCFKFLVCDWRDCWKGCKTEPFYVEQEYMLFDQEQKSQLSPEGRPSTTIESLHDEFELNASSSDSSKPCSASVDQSRKKKSKNQTAPKTRQNKSPNRSQTSAPNQIVVRKNGTRSGSSSVPHTPHSPHTPQITKLSLSKSSSSIGSGIPKAVGEHHIQTKKEVQKNEEIMRPISPIQPLSPMGF
ncbi:hypothetical protein K3495_g8603 [Podosphaera aphanis]|nr:hypothetical protein K3495_g8603 [Podosphaera aphanis]